MIKIITPERPPRTELYLGDLDDTQLEGKCVLWKGHMHPVFAKLQQFNGRTYGFARLQDDVSGVNGWTHATRYAAGRDACRFGSVYIFDSEMEAIQWMARQASLLN